MIEKTLRPCRFVSAEVVVEMFRTAPSIDYRDFRADLDVVADQDPMPRV